MGMANESIKLLIRGGSTLGQGARAPDSLVAAQIQQLADRSDVIFEVSKCSKIALGPSGFVSTGLGV